MKKFELFFVVILLVFSVGIVSAASYHGSFKVNTGGGSINIEPQCQEDWSASFWNSCSDGQQTFICIQSNPSCDSENLKPAQCGNTRECVVEQPPVNNNPGGGGSSGSGGGGSGSSSGGGGGGGASTTPLSVSSSGSDSSGECSESWACQGWSDLDNLCGIRSCIDKNNCGTEELRPETVRECPSEGFSGITGAVIGGISGLAKSKAGISLIFVVIVVALFAGITISRKNMAKLGEKISSHQ